MSGSQPGNKSSADANGLYQPESSAYIHDHLSGTVIGNAAYEAAINNQFPLQTATLVALCLASQACSAAYCVTRGHKGKHIPIGLYALAEQPPGTAKTGVMEDLQSGIMEAFSEINANRLKILKEIAQSEEDNKGKINEFEEAQRLKNQIIKAPMTDITAESIDKNLSNSNGWFMLASSEQALANTLIGGSYSEGSSNKDLLLKGFNGEWHASDRVTRVGFIGKPHGSVLILSQEGVIDTVLRSSSGSGLVERFLMILEGNMFGKRDSSKYGGSRKQGEVFHKVTKHIVMQVDTNEGMGIEQLRPITMSKKVGDMVFEQMDMIESLLADGEKYSTSMFRGIWSKMSTQIYKIAATIHLTEGFDESTSISKDHMVTAICIVKCILAGMINVCEAKGVSGKSVELAAVEDYMDKNAKGLNGKTMRQIKDNLGRKDVFQQHGSMKGEKIEESVGILCASGVIEKRINGKREIFVYRG